MSRSKASPNFKARVDHVADGADDNGCGWNFHGSPKTKRLMETIVGFIDGWLPAFLPRPWQRFTMRIGLAIAFGVGFALFSAQSRFSTGTVGFGLALVAFPFVYRAVVHLSMFFISSDRTRANALVLRYANGRPLFARSMLLSTDELVYFFIEEAGVRSNDMMLSIPYRAIIVTEQHAGRFSRDVILESEGWQLGRLFGADEDWSKVCGLVADGTSRTLAWKVEPSYGNRAANYSAYLSYFDIATNTKAYQADWRTHDDFTQPYGLVDFTPPSAGVPKSIRRHAVTTLAALGFASRAEESVMEREARFWHNTYSKALLGGNSVEIRLAWTRTSESFESAPPVAVGSDTYVATRFRECPIIRLRADGAWSVIFVGSSFPTIVADDGVLAVREGLQDFEYVPATSTLRLVKK